MISIAFFDNLINNKKSDVYLFCRPQIATLIANKALILIPIEYSDFTNVISPKLTSKLSEYTRINDYTIELVNEQQLLYRSIYSLELVELKILKTYIKTKLVNDFIKPSKSLVRAFIVFDKKRDTSF